MTENQTSVASYSYDSSKEEFVSYDTPNIANMKAQYVMDKGLAGSMFWDLSTDKTGDESLVYVTSQAYGSLDQTQNHIECVPSRANVRTTADVLSPATPIASGRTLRTTWASRALARLRPQPRQPARHLGVPRRLLRRAARPQPARALASAPGLARGVPARRTPVERV